MSSCQLWHSFSLSWFSRLCSLRPIWSAPRDFSYFSPHYSVSASLTFSDISLQHLDVVELHRLPCSCLQNSLPHPLAGQKEWGSEEMSTYKCRRDCEQNPLLWFILRMTVIKACTDWIPIAYVHLGSDAIWEHLKQKSKPVLFLSNYVDNNLLH